METLTHEEANRKNIPTAEFQSLMRKDEQSSIRVAYERRNRDLDPQLVWRGKDEQDWSDLVVPAPPIYIQEKVHPKVLIDDLLRRTAEGAKEEEQYNLFADFNGLPNEEARTEFYQHDANWTNRMILGDSLQVMASLAEREGLRGQVQCIYFDPPYGIKFNSNFQWSTTSRDVKDGNLDHITREPEQVKAFRDTWREGVHSYLTYLRDRLTVARNLLSESGSIFVQIGDENVHRLHPSQQQLVERDFGVPTRVSGSAGTGKTIVALHRAAFLARGNPDERVLLTTFSDALASALQTKLRRLISNEPRLGERLEVHSMSAIGQRLYELHIGRAKFAGTEVVDGLLAEAVASVGGSKFTTGFLKTELEQIVDAWQLNFWEVYRDVSRLGRMTRISETQRAGLWAIFEKVRAGLDAKGLITQSMMFTRLAVKVSVAKNLPFAFAVVRRRMWASGNFGSSRRCAASPPNGLFFAGDLGQRIFQQPFSWKAMGVDVRGRSKD